jgi:hypothetical protein
MGEAILDPALAMRLGKLRHQGRRASTNRTV